MEYNEIKRLLDRYFDGETTLDEEQALRDYFTSTVDIPSDLRYAAPMFAYAKQKRAQTRPVAARAALKWSPRRRFGAIATSTVDIPSDLRYAAPMFAYAKQKRAQTRPVAARAALKWSPRRRFGAIATSTAAAACIALGALAVFHSDDFSTEAIGDVAYCYLDGHAITDRAEAERVTQNVLDGIQADLRHSTELLASLSIFTK